MRWTSASQVLVALIALAQTTILARLLSPADFGALAACVVVIGLARYLTDFGITTSVLIESDPTPASSAALFWTATLLGAGAGIAILLIAHNVDARYDLPRAIPMLQVMSLSLLATGATLQPRALLLKKLALPELAAIDIASALISAGVSVALAWSGSGAMALALGQTAAAFIAMLFTWWLQVPAWRLDLSRSRATIAGALSLGTYQFAAQVINYLTAQLDVAVVGASLGAQSLGLYSASRDLCDRPAVPVFGVYNRVSLPLLSAARNERQALAHVYLAGLSMLSSVLFPGYLIVAALAVPLVAVLLGPQWAAASELVPIVCIYLMLRSSLHAVGTLRQALGDVRRPYYWNLAALALTLAFVGLGSLRGLVGVALALVALQGTLFLPGWWILVRPGTDIPLGRYLETFRRPILVAVGATAAAWTAQRIPAPDPVRLVIGAATGVLTALWLTKHVNPAAWRALKGLA